MKSVKQNSFALIAALIWGTAFIAQGECAKYLGPFTVNALRGIIATVVLAFIVFLFRKFSVGEQSLKDRKYYLRLIKGGIICGIALAVASNLQQAGLGGTSPGKAAFITAMYVVIVPVLAIFSGKKAGKNVWFAVFVTIIGFYFLCLYTEGLSLAVSDLFILLCAFANAVHILCIDRFCDVDGVELSCVQFAVNAVISTLCMFLFETPQVANITYCILPILYIAVFSSGVAYTLQILAQKNANPTVITLLLCMESVFAVLAERIIPGASSGPMPWWEMVGCALILFAVVYAQLPGKQKKIKG